MYKTAVIFTGGEAPPQQIVHNITGALDGAKKNLKPELSNVLVIAADSGLITAAEYTIKIDILLGDFDSITSTDEKLARIVKKYPVNKDYTDTELALLEAQEQGVQQIVLIGGNGGRFDHLLALRSMYERDISFPYPDIWFCGSNLVLCLDSDQKKEITIKHLTPDDYISIFPLYLHSLEPKIQSKGLQWDVTNLPWRTCGGSVSNKALLKGNSDEYITKGVELSVERGRFLVVLPLHEKSLFKVY